MQAAYHERTIYDDMVRRGHSLAPNRLTALAQDYNNKVTEALQQGTQEDDALIQVAAEIFPPKEQPRQSWITLQTWDLVQTRTKTWKALALMGILHRGNPTSATCFTLWKALHQWQRISKNTKRALRRDRWDH